eukprot:m.477952 g.477952  ORF g.477952 m.477952 type:complete len:221 (+) comp20991_c0_seq1:552-1214(+)
MDDVCGMAALWPEPFGFGPAEVTPMATSDPTASSNAVPSLATMVLPDIPTPDVLYDGSLAPKQHASVSLGDSLSPLSASAVTAAADTSATPISVLARPTRRRSRLSKAATANTTATKKASRTASASASSKKQRKPKKPVPDHLKDEKYWKYRRANTERARLCRLRKKAREAEARGEHVPCVPELEAKNTRLVDSVAELRDQLAELRTLVRGRLLAAQQHR